LKLQQLLLWRNQFRTHAPTPSAFTPVILEPQLPDTAKRKISPASGVGASCDFIDAAGIIHGLVPDRLIAGGLLSKALVADVLISKHADHLPLDRLAQILARDGVNIDRSTLRDWVCVAVVELELLHARFAEILKASPKLVCDKTRCSVLDPGRGKIKIGDLLNIARDNRTWGAVGIRVGIRAQGERVTCGRYQWAPGRRGEHARALFAGFSGKLPVKGYAGYNGLTAAARPDGAVTLDYY
jgi:transposase